MFTLAAALTGILVGVTMAVMAVYASRTWGTVMGLTYVVSVYIASVRSDRVTAEVLSTLLVGFAIGGFLSLGYLRRTPAGRRSRLVS